MGMVQTIGGPYKSINTFQGPQTMDFSVEQTQSLVWVVCEFQIVPPGRCNTEVKDCVSDRPLPWTKQTTSRK